MPDTLDYELLLAHVLQKPRSYLYAHPEHKVSAQEKAYFLHLCYRRLQGEPLAYLVNCRAFWKADFYVDARCLVPRPETELLVEYALTIGQGKAACRVLELGTGSGAIILSLASEHPDWKFVATDKAPGALAVARYNAKRLGIDTVQWYQCDWFTSLQTLERQPFDIIISNPPYIAKDDAHLQGDGVRYEPRTALVSDYGGKHALHTIIKQAKAFLKPGGVLILEHGYQQDRFVRACLAEHGWCDIKTHRDLGGMARFTVAFKVKF